MTNTRATVIGLGATGLGREDDAAAIMVFAALAGIEFWKSRD